jgi:hypothetical protein
MFKVIKVFQNHKKTLITSGRKSFRGSYNFLENRKQVVYKLKATINRRRQIKLAVSHELDTFETVSDLSFGIPRDSWNVKKIFDFRDRRSARSASCYEATSRRKACYEPRCFATWFVTGGARRRPSMTVVERHHDQRSMTLLRNNTIKKTKNFNFFWNFCFFLKFLFSIR